jgi:hypothetical protein
MLSPRRIIALFQSGITKGCFELSKTQKTKTKCVLKLTTAINTYFFGTAKEKPEELRQKGDVIIDEVTARKMLKHIVEDGNILFVSKNLDPNAPAKAPKTAVSVSKVATSKPSATTSKANVVSNAAIPKASTTATPKALSKSNTKPPKTAEQIKIKEIANAVFEKIERKYGAAFRKLNPTLPANTKVLPKVLHATADKQKATQAVTKVAAQTPTPVVATKTPSNVAKKVEVIKVSKKTGEVKVSPAKKPNASPQDKAKAVAKATLDTKRNFFFKFKLEEFKNKDGLTAENFKLYNAATTILMDDKAYTFAKVLEFLTIMGKLKMNRFEVLIDKDAKNWKFLPHAA